MTPVSGRAGQVRPDVPEIGCAAVLGLGLMGGSLARDLAARGVRVLGFDRDPAAVAAALDEGVLDAVLDESLSGLATASLVVFAVPVDAAETLLERAAPHLSAARLITDMGSTKVHIGAALEAAGLGDRFVGAHPLTGDDRSGWPASRRGLFRGARVYLCPAPSAGDGEMELAEALWRELGALPEFLDAAAHDRQVAWTSHLPQAVSTALALALEDAGMERRDLGPGGQDATRLAGSSAEMWVGIAMENAGNLAEAIAGMEDRLRYLRGAVERADVAELTRIFQAARRWRGAR